MTVAYKRVVWLALLLAGSSFAQYSPKHASLPTAGGNGGKYAIVDGHLHYLNFVQETAGMDAFFQAMDETGVTESAVIGMPVVKKWDESEEKRPTYYLDNDAHTYWYSATDFLVARAIQELPKEKQQRLHPFICGINSSDRNAVDHVERMLALYPGFWQGIGEVFFRHDDLTALTYGDAAHADSRAFDAILKIAEKHDLPALMHSNIGPAWLEKPSYVQEVEGALKDHPRARIIWAHAGISRRIVLPEHTSIIERMLNTYPNLTVDLSWVIFEQEIAPGGVLDKKWPALIEKFPGRFVLGSDVVGFFDQYKGTIQRYYLLLDALKPETAKKVASENFLALLPGRTITKSAALETR